VDVDNKIERIDSTEDFYKARLRVQNDILACAYKHLNPGASSKQLIDYVWCDSDLLLEELWYLDQQKQIFDPRFDKELIDNGGNNDTVRTVTLYPEGKRVCEERLSKNANNPLQLSKDWVPFASNKNIFLAHRFNEEELRGKVKKELGEVGFTIKEGKVEDLGYITEDILSKIKESGFFLALLTHGREFKDGSFATSPWILMEIGTAIAFERKVAILAEDTINEKEYASKLQRDCQHETFNRKNFDTQLQIIVNRIKNQLNSYTGSIIK
jgi:hypothetical protein